MAIEHIIREKCIGCETCVQSCPMDVIRMNEEDGKAEVTYPEECVVCCICVADCQKDAIVMTPGKKDVWFASVY